MACIPLLSRAAGVAPPPSCRAMHARAAESSGHPERATGTLTHEHQP